VTRDQARARAKEMRDFQIRWLNVARNPKMPFGDRYEAVIKAEDCDEAARLFDRKAEAREQTK
jgi:hypothetical protein